MRLRRPSDLWAARDGVSTIEFAFVSIILCALTLGMVDFGYGFWQYMQVESAAQAGAQYAMLNPGASNTNISSAVTIGTGSSAGAILLPGASATSPGTLTINKTLTLRSSSSYKCVLKRGTPSKLNTVAARGVTIGTNVPFTFSDIGTGTLTAGTVFTIIKNTSASPITGRFSNLSDGLILSNQGTNLIVSYTGGTGNDLTLTVQ